MLFALLLLLLAGMVTVGVQIIKHNRSIWGRTDRINSKILSTVRKVRVYLPASYEASTPNKQLYPVIYLLDGDAHCASVVAMLKQPGELNHHGANTELIVVAVKSSDRARDFTPTRSLIGPEGNKLPGLINSGGSEKFIAFIEKELVPYIESVYPASQRKAIIGHSLSGLVVMNILITQTKLFNAYVAIDPSMWWDNKKILNKAAAKFKDGDFTGTSLFLGVANTMPAGMDVKQAKNDTTGSTNHVRSILELISILESNPGNGLHWLHKYYADKDHGSVALPGIYDALRFLCDDGAINAAGTSPFVKNQ
jgi:predicted alpha/beta superfamily hydrolase